MIAKFCETSRNLSSALSREDDTSTTDRSSNRTRPFRSRTNSSRTTPNQTRKNSKDSEDIIELAKTVQDGMAELSIFEEENDLTSTSPEEMERKMEILKKDLLNKIKKNEDLEPRLASSLRRYSTEGSTDEIEEKETDRPTSRGLKSGGISFFGDVTLDENPTVAKVNNLGSGDEGTKLKREHSTVERKLSGKSVDGYCKTIIQDIEKSSKVIDRHVKEFNSTKIESEKLVKQLEVVDKISEFVSEQDIPEETLVELNNNFKMLTNQISENTPIARKRSISNRKASIPKSESRNNLFGDASLSNQDLLDDLLGKK